MIQIIESPQINRVLLDGNSTIIKIQSDLGATHYFRAKLYIDDELFDEQSWSREDEFTASKDLIKMYYSYFETAFEEAFTNGLTEQTHLIKKVNIEISEYELGSDDLESTVNLPRFYIMHNVKSVDFDNLEKITLLGLEPEVLRISPNGKIAIPFFVNADFENIQVTCTLDNDSVIDTQVVESVFGRKAYLYHFNLDGLIAYSNLYFTVSISVGATSVSKTYKIIRNPDFEIKELVFRNNFGYYIPVYFDGVFSDESGFSVETYNNFNGKEVVFAVEEEGNYIINTGDLLSNECAIYNQIANALECFFYNGTEYLEINTNQRKQLNKKDKQHLYNIPLSFTIRKGLPLDNNRLISTPIVTDLSVTGDENVVFQITKALFESSYTDDFDMDRIWFDTLPAVGELRAVFLSEENYPVFAGVVYHWEDLDYFTFVSGPNDSGTPYTSCEFKLSNGYNYSPPATLTININDLPDINLPPVISPNVEVLFGFYRPAVGSGSRTIDSVTVTDPEDDSVTLLWELPESPTGFSLTDATTINPTITADQTATPATSFVLRLTATDENSNETVQNFVTAVYDSSARLTITENSVVGSQTIYDVLVDRGIEGESLDIEFDYDVYDPSKYIAVDSDDIDNESIVSLLNRRQDFTKTFDENGEINFQITIEDASTPRENVTVTIQNPTGALVIDNKQEKTVL